LIIWSLCRRFSFSFRPEFKIQFRYYFGVAGLSLIPVE
jgi:hypothetical protein